MSFHYDFALACDLKPDTPPQVIDTLRYMTRAKDYDFDDPPDHDFFAFARRWGSDAWQDWLQVPPGYGPLPGEFGSSFRSAYRYTQFDQDVYRYTFSFRQYVLDDDFYELWWRFAAWLARHSESTGCVGYYREELDWQPTLIYFRDGSVYTCKVTQTPLRQDDGISW